jgi:hypothetical protein
LTNETKDFAEKANTLFHVNFAKTTHEKAKQTAAV